MRSNAIAEALIAKKEATPDIAIRILLDGQEYVSESYNNTQKNKQAACLKMRAIVNQSAKSVSTSDFSTATNSRNLA